MSGFINSPRSRIFGPAFLIPTRPRIFVSYHHGGDQWFYKEFSRVFHDQYEAIEDRSLDRAKDSDDPDYVRWAIANKDIKGTSCTIVLCGAQTYQRKYVDWEIKATLDDQHGLIGIRLPTATLNGYGQPIVPERLNANVYSGYAVWAAWENLSVSNLQSWIAEARSKSARIIQNQATIKQRNG